MARKKAYSSKVWHKRNFSDNDVKMMHGLIMEHAFARRTIGQLEVSKNDYVAGKTNALKDILQQLIALAELYPAHIQKEDKRFFYPSMKYFTQPEQEDMLNKFVEFDPDLTNRKYEQAIKILE
jgi:hemerythrin-like domain-containing protein